MAKVAIRWLIRPSGVPFPRHPAIEVFSHAAEYVLGRSSQTEAVCAEAGRIGALVAVTIALAGVAAFVALQLGAESDERVQKALMAKRGDAEADVVSAAGVPAVRRAIDSRSPKDVCSKEVNPTSAWALEYPVPNDGIGKWVRQLTGPTSRVYVCLDDGLRVVNTYSFVY